MEALARFCFLEDWISDACRVKVSAQDAERLERMHKRDTAARKKDDLVGAVGSYCGWTKSCTT